MFAEEGLRDGLDGWPSVLQQFQRACAQREAGCFEVRLHNRVPSRRERSMRAARSEDQRPGARRARRAPSLAGRGVQAMSAMESYELSPDLLRAKGLLFFLPE